MIIKQRFELIYKTSGNVYNVVPLSTNTLRAYLIHKDDSDYLISLVKAYSRIKNHVSKNIVEKHLNNVNIINFPDYPLPAFVNNRGDAFVNIGSQNSKIVISDFQSVDMYSLFLYCISLKYFINEKPFDSGVINNVVGMIFSIFMKIFGKKSGLIGSYKNLIPKLNFLIWMYVHQGMMGYAVDDTVKNKISSALFMNYKDLNLNYDFSSTVDFLRSIKENNIISISENIFSTAIINTGGINSLPMFEDISRFYSTLLSSDISGNGYFSHFWSKVNIPLYTKLMVYSLKTLNRVS